MADTTLKRVARIAVVALIAVVAINAAFYFLSQWYYEDKAKTQRMIIDLAAVSSVRVAFFVFTTAIAGASVLAGFSPREIGHALAAVLGVGNAIAGLFALAAGLTPVLGVALLIGGGTMAALAYYSYFKKSRAAWAFLASLTGVFGTCLLFGAPKVRSLVGIGLWTALIAPGLHYVAMTAKIIARGEYRDS